MPFGYSLTLFSEENWRGTQKTVSGEENLQKTGVGKLKCQPINKTMKKATSIRIDKQKQGKSTGYWKGITASADQTFTYTIGISSSDKGTTVEENVKTLTNSLEAGISKKVKGS